MRVRTNAYRDRETHALTQHNNYRYQELKIINALLKIVKSHKSEFDVLFTRKRIPIEGQREKGRYLNSDKVIVYFANIIERNRNAK